MIIEVYDVLISAGADEQKARKAAQVISEHNHIWQLKYLTTGLYIAGAAAFAYTFSLLNTTLSKV